MSKSERQALKAIVVTVLLLAATTLLSAQSQPQMITKSFTPDIGRPLSVKIRGDGAEIMIKGAARDGEGRARYRFDEEHFTASLEWEPEKNTFRAILDMDLHSFDTDDEEHESELKVLLPRRPEVDLDCSLKAGVVDLDGGGLTFNELELALWAGELKATFPTPSNKVIGRVEVDVKLGEMHLNELGNLACEELDVNGFAGEMTLDFSGSVSMRREARIDLEIGQITIYVPKGMAVQARISKLGFLAEVDIPGGWRKEGRYVYSPGTSRGEAELRLDIRGGIGAITIVER